MLHCEINANETPADATLRKLISSKHNYYFEKSDKREKKL